MARLGLSVRVLVLALGLLWPASTLAQAGRLDLINANREIAFQWNEGQFGDRIEPHAAILIPVQIQGSPKTLYMQFDLGAPATVLLKDKVDSLALRVPGLSIGQDGSVASFAFSMGEVQAEARNVQVVDVHSDRGIAWDEPQTIDIIGTVGADLLKGRILAIDYPHARMFVGDTVPSRLAAGDMHPLVLTPRGVILTGVSIDDEAKNIMLDTGSSAFALLTDEADWLRKTEGGANATSFPVNSWGRTLTAHIAPTRSVARFGDTEIPVGEVAYIEGVTSAQADAMRASGMGGMTGNKLFVDKILVLDAIHNRYSVLAPTR